MRSRYLFVVRLHHVKTLSGSHMRSLYQEGPLIKNFSLACRFAMREMRSGLRGFVIFFSCIVLGVATMAGVNGVSSLISDEFNNQGRTILGGDVRITMTQEQATREELAFFASQGQVAASIWMRSMARHISTDPSVDDTGQQLIEIKAIDQSYPLYGSFETLPAFDFDALFASRDGIFGVVIAPALQQRLGIEMGDRIEIGTQLFEVRGVVVNEPDLLSEGLQLGLRVFMARQALEHSSLLQEGSLYTRIYKIALSEAIGAEPEAFQAQLKQDFPERRWNLRLRSNAAPTLEANIKRFLQFLTLVGLTALIIGGTGIAQAVNLHLEKKRQIIAIFKTLGASASFIIKLYLVQVILISLMAIGVGLGLAALIPIVAKQLLQSFMPMSDGLVFYPVSLLIGAGFALSTVLAFSLIPLGQTRNHHVTALFRSISLQDRTMPPIAYLLGAVFLLLLIAFCAVQLGDDRRLSLIFMVAMGGVFLLLKLLDVVIKRLARRFAHNRFLVLRLALGNISRPGSLTAAVVRALGLSLTMAVALTTLDGNLRKQLSSATLATAPAFFFVDIASRDGEIFRQSLEHLVPQGQIEMMPMLRARITGLKNIPIEQLDIDEEVRWVVRGDRNVGFSSSLPEDGILVRGNWWEENYSGPPLVSFSAREATMLQLDVGDMIQLNVLGRTIEARIANLRAVDWDSMKMNFIMIFSPNTFAGAPYSYLATLMMPNQEAVSGLGRERGTQNQEAVSALAHEQETQNQEAKIAAELGKNFPSMTIISTRDILQDARDLADQIGLGVRVAAVIVLLASILVLAGALSAGNEKRARMAVILKILGARRRTLIAAFLLEYALLGFSSAIFAFVAGSAAGVGVAKFRMNLSQSSMVLESAALVLIAALILSVGLGLIGTWRILGQKPAYALREL